MRHFRRNRQAANPAALGRGPQAELQAQAPGAPRDPSPSLHERRKSLRKLTMRKKRGMPREPHFVGKRAGRAVRWLHATDTLARKLPRVKA
jgi:hypothetical protein